MGTDELMRKAFALAQAQQSNYKTLPSGQGEQKLLPSAQGTTRTTPAAQPEKAGSR